MKYDALLVLFISLLCVLSGCSTKKTTKTLLLTTTEEISSTETENNTQIIEKMGTDYSEYIEIKDVVATNEFVEYTLCDNGKFKAHDMIGFMTEYGGNIEVLYDEKWDSIYKHFEVVDNNVCVSDEAIYIDTKGTRIKDNWLDVKTLPTGKYRIVKLVMVSEKNKEIHKNSPGYMYIEFSIE